MVFGGGQKGWTESYYIRNVQTSIPAGKAVLDQLAISRAGLLGAGLYIKALRVQEVEDAANNPVLRVGDTFQGASIVSPNTQQPAHPDLSLLLDCTTQGLRRHKLIYLGGIWDAIEDNFGTYVPTPTWTVKLADFISKLITYGYGWRSRIPSMKDTITGYTVDDAGFVTITTTGSPFVDITAPKFLVNIRGLPTIGGQSPLNGERLVTKLANNICKTVESIYVGEFVGTGFLNTFGYTFEQIAAVGAEKIVSRERGAPLLESPGRR
jgi:hypothetical protein